MKHTASKFPGLFSSNRHGLAMHTTTPLHRRGFTLLEILVVMAIIGILAAITISAYGTVQSKARDARRKSDLENVARALELSYNDTGSYPAAMTFDGGQFGAGGMYMQRIPTDPTSGHGYEYQPLTIGGRALAGYRLYARLENLEDPVIPLSGTNVVQVFTDVPTITETSCGGSGCNYVVTSTNTSRPATRVND